MTILIESLKPQDLGTPTFRSTAIRLDVDNWLEGLCWVTSCDVAHVWLDDSCGPNDGNPETKCDAVAPKTNTATPFAIYSNTVACVAETESALKARALATVENGTDAALARALVLGSGADGCEGSLANATDITGSAGCVCASTALGALLRARGVAGQSANTWFTISESLIPHFISEGLVTCVGERYLALGKHPVIPGATTTGPDGTPADDGCGFIYAHGPVAYADSEATCRAYFNLNNDRGLQAEKPAIVAVDECSAFAIQVKADCC